MCIKLHTMPTRIEELSIPNFPKIYHEESLSLSKKRNMHKKLKKLNPSQFNKLQNKNQKLSDLQDTTSTQKI